VRQRGKLAGERAAIEAQLADLHQHESTLKPARAATINHGERQLSTFARASQNMAAVATLQDTLTAPSTDGRGQGVLATEEHPQHHCHTIGGEFLATLSQGHHIDPRPFQGRGA
jgi:hypothetical protein